MSHDATDGAFDAWWKDVGFRIASYEKAARIWNAAASALSETAPLVAGDLKTQREIHDSYAPSATRLKQEQVEWVVNDIAELGVKIGEQFFWLYKGHSLVYGSEDDFGHDRGVALHDNGTPMHWRPVGKREFGECCHPVNYKEPGKWGTVSLEDSDEWKPLPSARDE